jgi:hypothetical protein
MDSLIPSICRFYRLIEGAPAPRRADQSADGMLPVRAYRYCEAQRAASAYGFYIYPPFDFCLRWDGTEIEWGWSGADDWCSVRAEPPPRFRHRFEKAAPRHVKHLIPAFLTALREPGTIQVWSGYLARTAPGWALLSRGVANVPRAQPYDCYESYEGIVETSGWFGPLFTNIRLTKTHSPVQFSARHPLFQVQPLRPEFYREPLFEVGGMADLDPEDWERYAATMEPNTDPTRRSGRYASATRKAQRAEGGCPAAAAVGSANGG